MVSKPKEDRPQGFIPTLIICVVVAFIIIHSAFLKLTSSPDAELKKESYTQASSAQTQDKEPPNIKEPLAVKEPSAAKKISASKESSGTEAPSETPAKVHNKIPSILSLERGYHLHKIGNYEKAAAEYAKVITAARHRNDYTIQLLLACQEETVAKAFKNSESPEQLYYVPWRYNGRVCFKVCMGLFKSKGQAESNKQHIPNYFSRGGNRPMVVSVSLLAKGPSQK
jgi:hypothetical protein